MASICQAAAGGVLTAKQAPAGPAPPRRSVCAGRDGLSIVSQTSSRKENCHDVALPGCETRTTRGSCRPRAQRAAAPRFRPRVRSAGRPLLAQRLPADQPGRLPAGMARFTDSNLNGWGMACHAERVFLCGQRVHAPGWPRSTTSSGHVLPLTITVPGSAAGSAALGLGPGGHPTGRRLQPDERIRDLRKRQIRPGPPDLRFDRRHHQRLEPRRRSNACNPHPGHFRRRHSCGLHRAGDRPEQRADVSCMRPTSSTTAWK